MRALPGLLGLGAAILLAAWMLLTPAGLLGKADAIGYAVCHRIDARSFHLGERALPLCARCSGMYLGALVGLLYQARLGGRRGGFPPRRAWAVWALFVLAFGVDGVNSYLHLIPGAPGAYEPHNWLRLLTGTGMGLTMAGVIFPAFQQTVWRDWQNLPATRGLGDVAALVALGLGVDVMVLTENPLFLFPLALLSAATVIGLLTLIYTMIWVMLLRRENLSLRFADLLLPLTGGFGLALLQVAGLDLIRFALTGTWDGFHLG